MLTAPAGRSSKTEPRPAGADQPYTSHRLFLSGCLFLAFANAQTPYKWDLPAGFPKPRVPVDNPMTLEKVELGRRLFYDQRMSANGAQSCATCHIQSLAFTDGKPRAEGSTGEKHPRGSMSLVNVAYAPVLTWLDQGLHTLEEQARVPMFGRQPVELGMEEGGEKFLAIVRADPAYRRLFGPDPITLDNIVKAIACFERSIVSARSPYDGYHFDRDDAAVSTAARHGEVLFFSTGFSCFRCHGGVNFTGRPEKEGEFKAPTLRNIAVTAPYMHDGSVATLEEAVSHHSPMTPAERADIVEFLRTLTDEALLDDPRFSRPAQ